VQQQESRPLQT